MTNVSSHLSLIVDKLAALNTKAETTPSTVGRSYASAVANASTSDINNPVGNASKTHEPRMSSSSTSAHAHSRDPHDRKFNLLIFGLKECSKGTPKNTRIQKDYSDVCDILSTVETSVTSNVIRDCFRLGKFKEERAARPILVKLIRAHGVSSILANRKHLASPPGVSIKPDLTLEERRV